MDSRSVVVGGIRMRWEEAGEGPAVVFLHGIPTCPALWRRVIPLVPNARCLAWEMVGFGRSIEDGAAHDLSVTRQAEYLDGWMETLGLHEAIVVGHDLGGGVAQNLAVRHPDKVAGLVLTNSISYDSWPIPRVRAMAALGPLVKRVPDGLMAQVIRMFVHEGHDDRGIAEESFRLHWENYAQADGAAAFVRQTRALRTRDTEWLVPQLSRLRVPARIVWGAADKFQRVEYGRTLAKDLNAPLDEIPTGKHFVPEDHPDRIARAVMQVAEELRIRDGASISSAVAPEPAQPQP